MRSLHERFMAVKRRSTITKWIEHDNASHRLPSPNARGTFATKKGLLPSMPNPTTVIIGHQKYIAIEHASGCVGSDDNVTYVKVLTIDIGLWPFQGATFSKSPEADAQLDTRRSIEVSLKPSFPDGGTTTKPTMPFRRI
jgi:hypothetical protein